MVVVVVVAAAAAAAAVVVEVSRLTRVSQMLFDFHLPFSICSRYWHTFGPDRNFSHFF